MLNLMDTLAFMSIGLQVTLGIVINGAGVAFGLWIAHKRGWLSRRK